MRADRSIPRQDYLPLFHSITQRTALALVLSVGGEIDLAVEDDFRTLLAGALDDAPACLVLDLGNAFLDVRALTVLLIAAERARIRGVRVALAAPPALLLRMLTALQVREDLLSIHPSVDAAIGAGGTTR